MQGRLERQLKHEELYAKRLATLPSYLQDFYNYLVPTTEYMTRTRYVDNTMNFILYIEQKRGTKITSDKLKTLTASDIISYMNSLQYTKDNQGNIKATSDSHRCTLWSAINKFFQFLVKTDVLLNNPCDKTDRPQNNDTHNIVALTPEEALSIFKKIEEYNAIQPGSHSRLSGHTIIRDKAMIRLMLATGMRVAALVELNCDNIDWETGEISTVDKRRKHNTYRLDDETLQMLDEWMNSREQLLASHEPVDSLFISVRHQVRLTPRAIEKLVAKYTSHLEKHVTPHKLRSTYGTTIYNTTHDIYYTAQCMGHNSINTTMRYINPEDRNKTKASNIMASFLGNEAVNE